MEWLTTACGTHITGWRCRIPPRPAPHSARRGRRQILPAAAGATFCAEAGPGRPRSRLAATSGPRLAPTRYIDDICQAPTQSYVVVGPRLAPTKLDSRPSQWPCLRRGVWSDVAGRRRPSWPAQPMTTTRRALVDAPGDGCACSRPSIAGSRQLWTSVRRPGRRAWPARRRCGDGAGRPRITACGAASPGREEALNRNAPRRHGHER